MTMQQKIVTLYSRNSNKEILEWEGKVYSTTQGTAMIEIKTGLLKGVKTGFNVEVIEGKNIGKSNETTPYQQAVRDLEGRVLKLKRKGYKELTDIVSNNNGFMMLDLSSTEANTELLLKQFLPLNNTDMDGYEKPMKAQPYYKGNGDICIKFPCYGQPKINGFRCSARYIEEIQNDIFSTVFKSVEFKSKNGLTYGNLKHIEKDLLSIYENKELDTYLYSWYGINLQDIIFDGEMYIKNTLLEDISSAVRKTNDNTPKLKYVIFDLAIKDFTQKERLLILKTIFSASGIQHSNLIKINTITINNDEEAQKFTDNCILEGDEGAIFRDRNATYQFGKRPQTMVKLKRKESKEFLIVNVISGEVAKDLAIFVCKAENGETFNVTPEGSHETRRNYLINPYNYIGKYLTVEFYERTKRGVPFHAVGITVRDYE